jgi:gliding motility-associated-like protein
MRIRFAAVAVAMLFHSGSSFGGLIPAVLAFQSGGSGPNACGFAVQASADTTICAPGDPLSLNVTPSAPALAIRWRPGHLFDDSTRATPVIRVQEDVTLQVIAWYVQASENLIVNGDFSLGDFGFRSDYRYGRSTGSLGILGEENQYAITNDPTRVHRRFAQCSDRSPGNGNMMVVNGSGEANNVWCQTVQVRPNTEYAFSAWVASMVSQNPARLQFSINGVMIGEELVASPTTCRWDQFHALWKSNGSQLIEICIANVNNTIAGNDFALDDIAFSPVCMASDEVRVTVARLSAEWTPPAALCRNTPPFALETLLAEGATPGGQWTIDGQVAGAIDPLRLPPGERRIEYVVRQAACQVSRQHLVSIIEAPSAGLPLPPLEVCAGVDSIIELGMFLRGADANGLWTEIDPPSPPGRPIDASKGTLHTSGRTPGTYTFVYSVSGPAACPADSVSTTLRVAPLPIADAGPDQTLDCTLDEARLGGPAQSSGDHFRHRWSSPTDPEFHSENPVLTVMRPGIFALRVTDLNSGCAAYDTVQISSQITSPVAAYTVEPVTCFGREDGAIVVNEVVDGAAPFLFSLNGDPFSPRSTFEHLRPGRYILEIEDAGGCRGSHEILIEQPTELNVALVANRPGETATVTLGDSLRLSALVNVPAENIAAVEWLPNGPDCADCLEWRFLPLAPATYSVTVTDLWGCQAEGKLRVSVLPRRNIFVPSAFSPNNDGVNDVLMIFAGNEVRQVRHFRVLDRWGNVLFQARDFPPNDPRYGWNGRGGRGGEAPNGVYVYMAEVELVDGASFVLNGDITLVR